ncbi:MAG TPA: hypothetical protein PK639_03790 [Candidatus Woesebacteria bacterium]|nr:hypothetical protein [Candidatus Woesebacteria bacterium]
MKRVFLVLALFLVLAGKVTAVEFFEETIDPFKNYSERKTSVADVGATGIYYYEVKVYLEKQSAEKYPNYRSLLIDALTELNRRLEAAKIERRFKFGEDFVVMYDKNVSDGFGCVASNPEGKHLPKEFCNSNKNYILVAADETGGSNYSVPSAGSVEWHGRSGLFTGSGVSVLVHELGHCMGLPDIYGVKVMNTENKVNGEGSPNWFDGYIMNNLTPGLFHPWDIEVIKREKRGLIPNGGMWVGQEAKNNILVFKDKEGKVIRGAKVSVYGSIRKSYSEMSIDNIAKKEGITGVEGEYNMGNGLLGNVAYEAIRVFIIKIEKDGITEYKWLTYADINLAYWKQSQETVVYELGLNKIIGNKTKVVGDASGDGLVDILDYGIWKKEYVSNTKEKADFNNDAKVDLLDYSVWKREYGGQQKN